MLRPKLSIETNDIHLAVMVATIFFIFPRSFLAIATSLSPLFLETNRVYEAMFSCTHLYLSFTCPGHNQKCLHDETPG